MRKTAQAVSSKSQTPNLKNPSSDHESFRHSIFIEVSALSALCVVHPVLPLMIEICLGFGDWDLELEREFGNWFGA
jgi:hypothetical protein